MLYIYIEQVGKQLKVRRNIPFDSVKLPLSGKTLKQNKEDETHGISAQTTRVTNLIKS